MPNQEEILKQAKKIMDEFVSALDKVRVKEKFGVRRQEQLRTPSKKQGDSSAFKKRMLQNAPKTKDDFLLMEKKEW